VLGFSKKAVEITIEETEKLRDHDQLKEGTSDPAASKFGFSPKAQEISNLGVSKAFNIVDGIKGDESSEQEESDFFLEEGEDLMSRLGAGIVSYFSLVRIMSAFLILIALCFLPVMNQYASWQPDDADTKSVGLQYSIGNLGESSLKCAKTKMLTDSTILRCQIGTINAITNVGVFELGSPAEFN